MPATDHTVTLITRVGCHLCEQAEAVLRPMATELGFGYHEVDVDSDPELKARHSDDVPVILLDGRQHGYWRVEETRLRRDLAK
jgi:glutaredoxin